MSHKTYETIRLEIKFAKEKIKQGAVYQHYKNKQNYKVLGFVVIESNDEVSVRYANVVNLDVEFVRPANSFTENVENNGRQVKRFKKV